MNPQLLQQLTQQLQQMATASAAASQAAAQMASALGNASSSASSGLNILNTQAILAGRSFNSMNNQMPTWQKSMFRLVQAVGQAVLGHAQLATSLIRLNKTIYETENVFQNMGSQLEVGQNAISNALQVMGTGLQSIPVIGDLLKTSLEAAGQAALSLANEQFQQIISASSQVYDATRKVNTQFGLLTSDLDKFSQQATRAGLTSGQFGRILSDNAQSLTQAFGNITKSAEFVEKQFSLLTGETGSKLMRQFRGLGMELDDIGEALADYAAFQTLTGQKVSDKEEDQIANTIKYVGNLKVLQAITGEDIKTQRQRQRDLLQQAAFRAKYDQMVANSSQEQADKMMFASRVAGQFGPAAEKAFLELVTSGQIMTAESGQFAAQFPALAESLQKMAQQSQTAGQTMDDFQKSLATDLTNRQALIKADQARVAQSGLLAANLASNSPYLQSLSQSFVEVQNVVGRLGNLAAAVSKAQEQVQKSSELGKIGEFELENFTRQQRQRMEVEGRLLRENQEMLDSTMAFLKSMDEAQKAINSLYSGVTAKVTTLVADLGTAVTEVHTAPAKLKGIVNALNNLIPNLSGTFLSEKEMRARVTDLASQEVKLREEANKGLQGSATKLKEVEAELTTLHNRLLKKEATPLSPGLPGGTKKEMASGGIASGPKTGYQAILHGTEAVVPLPDNRSIPVTFNTSALESSMQALAERMSSQQGSGTLTADLTKYLEANNAVVRELLREMRKNNEISDKMLRLSA
jgi:hypothetical protein